MKFAVIGGSGFTGTPTVAEALGRGHQVSALVRHPEELPAAPGLTGVEVDVMDRQALAAALAGHDCVVSCFSTPSSADPEVNTYREIVEGTCSIIAAVKASPLDRLIYVGGAGSLYLRPGVMLIDEFGFIREHMGAAPEGLRRAPGPPSADVPRAARIAYYLVTGEDDLRWTFVSPSLFLGEYGGPSGRLRYGGDELLMEGEVPARLDVADLAVAVVTEAERGDHVRSRFTVATDPAARLRPPASPLRSPRRPCGGGGRRTSSA